MKYILALLIFSNIAFGQVSERLKQMSGDIVCLESNEAFGDRTVIIKYQDKSKCTFDLDPQNCVQIELIHGQESQARIGKITVTPKDLHILMWDETKKLFDTQNVLKVHNKKGSETDGTLPYYFGGTSKMRCLIK